MADVSTQIKFLYGAKDGIEGKIKDGTIEGSDLVITSDTSELVFVDKSKNLKPIKSRTELEHTVVGTSIGALQEGEVVPDGITLDEFIAMICQKRVPASYAKPDVLMDITKGSPAGMYEAGEELTVSVSATYLRNDGGPLISLELIQDQKTLASSTMSPVMADDREIVVPDGKVYFIGKASYTDGPVKLDNLGDASPEGRIEAGSVVSSNSLVFTGARKYFCGTGAGELPVLNSENIRQLNGELNPSKGMSFKVSLGVGEQHIIIAYPQSLGDIEKIRYEELNDDHVAQNFTKKIVGVDGANGYEAIPYNVYTYKMATPAEAGMNFTVTI